VSLNQHGGGWDQEITEFIFNLGVLTLDDLRSNGNQALKHSILNGNVDMTKWLLGLDVLKNEDYSAVFYWACETSHNHESILQILSDHGLLLPRHIEHLKNRYTRYTY